MRAKTATTFRVVKLPVSVLDAMRRRRDSEGTTSIQFVAGAVSRQLPVVLERLQAIGVGAARGSRQAARLPFSDRAGTLGSLKSASRDTGLSGTQLLALCLTAASNSTGIVAKKRRPKKSAPAATRRRRY
jgi:hypothetical protein